jgi:acyl-coenzyme A thioesterase PaaI-like protein
MDIYIEDGKSKVDFITVDCFRGYEDRLHGGIISSVLDEVMAWAPIYAKKRMCVSAEITIRFVRPIPIGIAVTVEGEFIKDRRLIWDTLGRITGIDGTVYARAKGKYLPISMEETIKIDDTMIYPEGMRSIFRE